MLVKNWVRLKKGVVAITGNGGAFWYKSEASTAYGGVYFKAVKDILLKEYFKYQDTYIATFILGANNGVIVENDVPIRQLTIVGKSPGIGKFAYINDTTLYMPSSIDGRGYLPFTYSKDYGVTWHTIFDSEGWGGYTYTFTATDIHFFDENTGIIIGHDGKVLKTTTGGIPTPVLQRINYGRQFNLSQNYPNPFNPSTKITFTLPKSESVNLQVYNTLSQIVGNLVEDKLQAGSHEFEFNASHLPSGVYFYRLQAGEYVDVKKMLLLK